MDIYHLEYAAQMFFRFCKQNPDLCPHDWEWHWVRTDSETTKSSNYQCRLCGTEKTIQLERRENESDYDWERRY